MERCRLELGPAPWERLTAEGGSTRLHGTIAMGNGPFYPALVQVRGAHSRRFPKKSVQVRLTDVKLPDEPPTGHRIRTIHLNADFVDPTLMRSALSYRLFEAVGALAPRCRHLEVEVSGAPAGVYLGMESVDPDWCRRRGLPIGPIYYAINRNANFGLVSPFSKELKQPLDSGYHPVRGADTTPLEQMILAINMADDLSFPEVVQQWVDVTGYLRWLMTAVFVGNRDGFVHNYALYLNPQEHRFQIIPWDYDATWGIDIHGNFARLDRVPVAGWNTLSRRLMGVTSLRKHYRRLFERALDGPFSPPEVAALVDALAATAGPVIQADPFKSGSPDQFEEDLDALKRWAIDRRRLLLEELDEL
jgi:spore coat protein H